eukprot:2930569-Rhodomonas_salina.1
MFKIPLPRIPSEIWTGNLPVQSTPAIDCRDSTICTRRLRFQTHTSHCSLSCPVVWVVPGALRVGHGYSAKNSWVWCEYPTTPGRSLGIPSGSSADSLRWGTAQTCELGNATTRTPRRPRASD